MAVLQEFSEKTDLLRPARWLESIQKLPKRRIQIEQNSQRKPSRALIGAVMVLFDLNSVRGTSAGTQSHEFHSSAFQGDVLAPVKTVKRLSTHPWPFTAKSGSGYQAESLKPSRLASSFVT